MTFDDYNIHSHIQRCNNRKRKEFYLLAVGYLKLVFVFLRGQLHIIEFRKYPKSALIEQKNGKKVRFRETALLS